MANGHVGGETGFSLWAGIFSVPLLACYRKWEAGKHVDWRPAEFHKPVHWCPLDTSPADAVARAMTLFK
jgi:hypothetical protein